jgi:hypothetical protein
MSVFAAHALSVVQTQGSVGKAVVDLQLTMHPKKVIIAQAAVVIQQVLANTVATIDASAIVNVRLTRGSFVSHWTSTVEPTNTVEACATV